MFKISDRASFLIIFFGFSVFVVLYGDVCCHFPSALLLRLLHQRRKLHTKPSLHSKIVSEYDQDIPQSQTADNPVAPFGNYWASAMFRGPDFIA